MPLYHVSSADLAAGAILQPGRWGEVVRAFSRQGRALTHLGDAKILAWEASLEAARLALAPGSPSRLNCLFTCRELKDATTFRDRFRPTSSIYEVAKTDEAAPTHVADYEMITDTGDEPFVDIWVQSALRYWRADDPALAEVLVGGAVSVIQRL